MSSERKGWSFLRKLEKEEHSRDGKQHSEDKEGGDKTEDKTVEAPDGKQVTMSRGPRPEMDVDFEQLKSLVVYDEHGKEVRFTELFVNQKTIVVFTRHFLDFISKEYVEDLAIIPAKHLQDAGVSLVVIGPSPYKFIKPFRAVTNYQYPLYCDPDRKLYKALGLREKLIMGHLQRSKHVKSGALGGTLKSVWRAMHYQEYQGDTRQQGGSFIMGPGEEIHFHHQDATSADHMNINDLLIEAGVQTVSFPKDQRVITI